MIDKSENRNPIYSELNFIVYFCLDCEAMVLDYKGKLCKDYGNSTRDDVCFKQLTTFYYHRWDARYPFHMTNQAYPTCQCVRSPSLWSISKPKIFVRKYLHSSEISITNCYVAISNRFRYWKSESILEINENSDWYPYYIKATTHYKLKASSSSVKRKLTYTLLFSQLPTYILLRNNMSDRHYVCTFQIHNFTYIYR